MAHIFFSADKFFGATNLIQKLALLYKILKSGNTSYAKNGRCVGIMEYSFNVYNKMATTGLVLSLGRLIKPQQRPVILCIGSDLAIGDSLGPVCGTMLLKKKYCDLFVYGTLKKTITAKEIKCMNDFLHETHPGCPVIAIDAAVGDAGDIGLIRVTNNGIRPGLGANKRLGKVGDIGILGIVAEKSVFNYSLLNLTRLNLVYRMADIISDAVADFSARSLFGETGEVAV